MKTVKQEKERFAAMFQAPATFHRSRNYWTAGASAFHRVTLRQVYGVQRYCGLRDVGKAHDIIRLRHTGWYADSEGFELYVPQVWQLPARNRIPQYISGFVVGDSDCVLLSATDFKLDIFDSKEDAARAADSFAEIRAEHAREWSDANDAEFIAEQSVEDARESMLLAFGECRAIVAELRTAGIPKAIRARISKALCAEHAKARKFIGKLSDALVDLGAAREQMAYLERRSEQA